MEGHRPVAKSALKNKAGTKSRRWLGAVVIIAAVGAAGVWASNAWRQAERREAFLPELQAEARRSPDDADLLALLGARLTSAEDPGDKAQATTVFVKAISGGREDDPSAWMGLAVAEAGVGDIGKAQVALNKGLQVVGASDTLSAAISRVNALSNPTPASVIDAISPGGPASLDDACAPANVMSHVIERWGRNNSEKSGYVTRRDWAKAQPQNVEAQRLWGLALMRERRLGEAVRVLAAAANLAPRSAPVQIALGESLETGGANNLALNAYLAAASLDPKSAPALEGLGRMCALNGLRYDRDAFKRATALDPSSVDGWIGLGHADAGQNTYLAECLNAFKTAQKLRPNRTDYFDDYAQALTTNGQTDMAEDVMRRRIADKPDDGSAHYMMSNVLMHEATTNDRLTQAESEARKAVDLNGQVPAFKRQLGDILLRENKAAEAIDALSQSLAQDPTQAEAQRLISRAYAAVGQSTKASQSAALAASLSDASSRINHLITEVETRYSDPGYHRELIGLYTQTGQRSEEEQERDILGMILKDPKAAEKTHRQFVDSVHAALGANQ